MIKKTGLCAYFKRLSNFLSTVCFNDRSDVELLQAMSVLENSAALKRDSTKLLAFEILCLAAGVMKRVRYIHADFPEVPLMRLCHADSSGSGTRLSSFPLILFTLINMT
jgi:hypothetical protein